VRSLFENCQRLQEQTNRESLDRVKAALVRELTFRGLVFDAFSKPRSDAASPEAELAARYQLLLKLFREATKADDRLHVIAQWLWAELGAPPETLLGETTTKHLVTHAQKRVSGLQLNDFYYAQVVQHWLPYAERLFQDARSGRTTPRTLNASLRSLGHDPIAVDVFFRKKWRSQIEFTCEWLAARGGIKMLKARRDPDMARTLRNAYSRILGQGVPHCP